MWMDADRHPFDRLGDLGGNQVAQAAGTSADLSQVPGSLVPVKGTIFGSRACMHNVFK
jgi:hypothetical protein